MASFRYGGEFERPRCSVTERFRVGGSPGARNTHLCGLPMFEPCRTIAAGLGDPPADRYSPSSPAFTLPAPAPARVHTVVNVAPGAYRSEYPFFVTHVGRLVQPDCERFPAACLSSAGPLVVWDCGTRRCAVTLTSGVALSRIAFVGLGEYAAVVVGLQSRVRVDACHFSGLASRQLFTGALSMDAYSAVRVANSAFFNNSSPSGAAIWGRLSQVVVSSTVFR